MKNKKGELNLYLIFIIFIGIVVGIAFFTEIGNTQNLATDKQLFYNETHDLTSCYVSTGQINVTNSLCNVTVDSWYDSDDWRASHSSCNIGSVAVRNSTGSALTVTTDYVVYAGDGIIQFKNNTDTNATRMGKNVNNNSLITYDICAEGYNVDASSRGVARLWTIFTALIIALLGTLGIREWLKNR